MTSQVNFPRGTALPKFKGDLMGNVLAIPTAGFSVVNLIAFAFLNGTLFNLGVGIFCMLVVILHIILNRRRNG